MLEHISSGKLDGLEGLGFLCVVLDADHRNGIWKGTGSKMGRMLNMTERGGRRILNRLIEKGYLTPCGFGYTVKKYFNGDRNPGSAPPEPRVRTTGTQGPLKKQKWNVGSGESRRKAERRVRVQEEQLNIQEEVLQEGAPQSGAIVVLAPPPEVPIGTWAAYREMRIKIRKPMTEHAAHLVLQRLLLLKAEGHDPQAVLEQSIMNSWQGVFPIKGENGNGKKYGPPSAEEHGEMLKRNARAAGFNG